MVAERPRKRPRSWGIVAAVALSMCLRRSQGVTGDRAYDFGTSVFSPEGRIIQVEYAMQAVERSKSAIGICTKEGVVLCALRRRFSKLQDDSRVGHRERLHKVADHILYGATGVTGDALVLLKEGRQIALSHALTFQEPIPVAELTAKLGDTKQAYTQYGGLRPWGVSLLLAGWDEWKGFQLYKTDPSGNFGAFHAVAVGTNARRLMDELADSYDEHMTLGRATMLAARLLGRHGMDGGKESARSASKLEHLSTAKADRAVAAEVTANGGAVVQQLDEGGREKREEELFIELGTIICKDGQVTLTLYSTEEAQEVLRLALAGHGLEGDLQGSTVSADDTAI